ncbi:MAG: hypothetical protein LUQ05_05160, partial [Methanoregula sp.]|nr:hypothetical protein [Methanoregula sp.]
RQLDVLQGEYRTACATLETKENMTKSLERDLAASVAEKEKSEEQLRAVQTSYETSLAGLNQELAQANSIRAALETDLDAAKTQIRTYTEELDLANKGSTESGQQLSMLKTELDLTRKTLEEKESLVQSLRDDLARVALEKEKTDEQVRADIESYKTTFIRLKHDLDETLSSRRMLERDLALANHTKEQAEQQSRLLADELGRVKAEFEHEQRLHLTSDKSLKSVEENRKRFEEDLRISADNLTSLKEQLEDERKARLIAEEKSISADLEKKRLEDELRTMTEKWDHQEQDRAVKFQNLKKDLETVCDLQKSLEEEVSVLNEEKLKAEQKVQELTRELAQARTALADEWEDHMTSDERLAAAVLEQQRLKKSLSQSGQPGTEEIVQEIVAKEPDLPVKIDQASQSLELVIHPEEQTAAAEDEHVTQGPSEGSASQDMRIQGQNLSGMEDLYEIDEQAPLPVQESEHVSGGTEEEILQESMGSDEEKEDLRAEGDIYGETKSGEWEQTFSGTYDSVGTVPGPAFSFNRRQWLSLIKWAHHSEALSRDQRLQIIRMGRLIQKNRRLTREQEVQVREMIALVQALGYKPE